MRKLIILLLVALVMQCGVTYALENESTWENILLLGSDSRNVDGRGLTDTMIILSVNRDESLVKMTSIMRDTWVKYAGRGFSGKINAANSYGGPELAVNTVNECYGTAIEDYVVVDMDDLCAIVDLMGGVKVEITEAERDQININITDFMNIMGKEYRYDGALELKESGNVVLNGAMAVGYCRIRKIDSDFQRVMRQQEVLLSLADAAQNMEVDMLMEAAERIYSMIETSMEWDEIKSLGTAFMVMDIHDVEQFRIPSEGAYTSGNYDGIWMIRPNLEKDRYRIWEFIYR